MCGGFLERAGNNLADENSGKLFGEYERDTTRAEAEIGREGVRDEEKEF